ncbi:MAG: Transcription termination/antitermination protein NusG [Candidatus Phytoplasma pruni]
MIDTKEKEIDKVVNKTQEKQNSKKNNDNEAKWYIIQTYSGYENSVKEDLLRIADSGVGISSLILDALCPKETYYKTKADGTKQTREKKIYSGYVFVKMVVTDHSWFVVRNIPKVTGFLGSIRGGGSKPVPLSDNEIRPILLKMGIIAKPNYDYLIGKQVEITNGSFAGQTGKVSFVDHNQDKIIVEIDLFGRATPIEISFDSFKVIL